MTTHQERIEKLEAELATAKALDKKAIKKGGEYWTSFGFCKVTEVYTEDGYKKVRGEWQGLDRNDYSKAVGEPYVRSLGFEKFKRGIMEYPQYKKQRELEIEKGAY